MIWHIYQQVTELAKIAFSMYLTNFIRQNASELGKRKVKSLKHEKSTKNSAIFDN